MQGFWYRKHNRILERLVDNPKNGYGALEAAWHSALKKATDEYLNRQKQPTKKGA
jgi:GTP-binding protein EngB required for normal cell division